MVTGSDPALVLSLSLVSSNLNLQLILILEVDLLLSVCYKEYILVFFSPKSKTFRYYTQSNLELESYNKIGHY